MSFNLMAMATDETRLFDFEINPISPKLDDEVTIYVAAKTDFTSANQLELIGEFFVNNQVVSAQPLSPLLWMIRLPAPHTRGTYALRAKLSIQDRLKAKSFLKRIAEIKNEILDLEAQVVTATDSNARTALMTQIESKRLAQSEIGTQLSQLPQLIGEDQYSFAIDTFFDATSLLKMIRKSESRHAQIQNNDFGWDYYVDNQNDLRVRTETSYANQFGLHAMGLLDAYKVTGHAYYLRQLENTAQAILNLPINVKVGAKAARCTYIYGTDSSFMYHAGMEMGFPELTARSQLSAQGVRKCLAAMHVLNILVTTDDAIDTVSEADLANVTDLQRAQKYRAYLETQGRPAGLRAYDFLNRFEEALVNGDRGFAYAMAQVVAADISGVIPTDYYYLLGVGSSLEILGEFVTQDPSFAPIIQTLITNLLPFQKADGLFEYMIGSEVGGGGTQDMAFVLRGLLKVGGQDVMINKSINGLKSIQQEAGSYFIYNYEFVEGEAELMSALSRIAFANDMGANKINFAQEINHEFAQILEVKRHLPDMKRVPSRFMVNPID